MIEWGRNSTPPLPQKNASMMGNLLPPNNNVVHKSQVQELDVTNFIHDSLSLSFTATTMSLKTKTHFSLFYFNATANSESRIYAITRYLPKRNNSIITVVCRFYFDIEVIRIIVFVMHSLVIKNIRYDSMQFFSSDNLKRLQEIFFQNHPPHPPPPPPSRVKWSAPYMKMRKNK